MSMPTRVRPALTGPHLRDLLRVVVELNEMAVRLARRGVSLRLFLEARSDDGRLPLYRVRRGDGAPRFLFDEEELALELLAAEATAELRELV